MRTTKSAKINKTKNNSKNIKNNAVSSKPFKSKDVNVRGYYGIIIFIALLMFDRMTKIMAIGLANNPKDYGFLEFVYVLNTGAGFSILTNMNLLLIVISTIALAAIAYYREEVPKFSLITIVSGTAGNLIDRITYGGVIDFINFKFFPIFNVADSLIFIGVAYWIIVLIRKK